MDIVLTKSVCLGMVLDFLTTLTLLLDGVTVTLVNAASLNDEVLFEIQDDFRVSDVSYQQPPVRQSVEI